MNMLRWLLLPLLVSLSIGCSSRVDSPSVPAKAPGASPASGRDLSTATPQPGPTESTPTEVVKINVSEYGKEFKVKEDAKMAAAKYRGKLIELTGVVARFEPAYDYNKSDLTFKNPGSQVDMLCTLKGIVPAGELAIGQTVTIRGKNESFLPAATVTDAVIVSKGPDTAIRMTAEELVKAAADDFRKLRDITRDKTLIVSGEVLEVKQDPTVPVRKLVFLKGDDKLKVQCLFGLSDKEKQMVNSLKPGDKVACVGEPIFVDEGYVNLAMCFFTK